MIRWVEQVAEGASLASVASELGLSHRSGRWVCPACEAERTSKDPRPPVVLDRERWRCWACDAGGRAVDLVGHRLGLEPTSAEVRAWFADRGLCEPGSSSPVGPRRKPRPLPAPPAPVQEEKPHLAPDEVAAFWEGLPLLLDDSAAAEAVRARFEPREGLTGEALAIARTHASQAPERLEALDLVRALPREARAPRWAWSGEGSWAQSGHRLILPLFDAAGRLAGVLGRRIPGEAAPDANKALKPAGHTTKGLVLACPLARQVLQRGARPEWWPTDEPFEVIIAEGGPDFWTWSTRYSEAHETAPAVFGLGDWSQAIADRIPAGSRVELWTDDDDENGRFAGYFKAKRVAKTLGHCTVTDRPNRKHYPKGARP